jgi:hypothetical protein
MKHSLGSRFVEMLASFALLAFALQLSVYHILVDKDIGSLPLHLFLFCQRPLPLLVVAFLDKPFQPTRLY